MSPHRPSIAVALALGVALVGACSGDDDDGESAPTGGTQETVVDTTIETSPTELPGTSAPDTTAAATTAAAEPTAAAETTAPPPPGATSDDPTCRAAGEFFSSLNALIYPLSTSDVVGDPTAAQQYATLEVLGAPTLLAAAQALETSWPAPAAGELADVKAGFLDPFMARLQAGVTTLAAAGVTPAEQAELDAAWRGAVAFGATSTEVSNLRPQDLGVSAALAAKVEQAGSAQLAGQGGLLESGIFGVGVTYPQLEQYLLGACPDVADLVTSNF